MPHGPIRMMELTPAFLLLVWIPISGLVVHRAQRLKACIFAAACAFTFILQVELLQSLNLMQGVSRWFNSPADIRGLIGWSGCILIYLGLSMASPGSRGILYFAASLSIYIIACLITSFIMIL